MNIQDTLRGKPIWLLSTLEQKVKSDIAIFGKMDFLTNELTKAGRLITICKSESYKSNNKKPNQRTNQRVTKDQPIAFLLVLRTSKKSTNGIDQQLSHFATTGSSQVKDKILPRYHLGFSKIFEKPLCGRQAGTTYTRL